jgi:hypothetical protein
VTLRGNLFPLKSSIYRQIRENLFPLKAPIYRKIRENLLELKNKNIQVDV